MFVCVCGGGGGNAHLCMQIDRHNVSKKEKNTSNCGDPFKRAQLNNIDLMFDI